MSARAEDIVAVMLIAALALVPLLGVSNTVVNFLVTTLIITLTAQGWNLLAGYAGQYSFGHAAFFGVAGYTTAVMQVRLGINAWPAFAMAVAGAALIGWVIGLLAFRAGLRGSYFALVTLAFAEVFRILANADIPSLKPVLSVSAQIGWYTSLLLIGLTIISALSKFGSTRSLAKYAVTTVGLTAASAALSLAGPVTGGAAGIQIKLQPGAAAFQFPSRSIFLWITLTLVALVMLMTRALERRRLGVYMVAVRENEAAASALGVDTLRVKLAAITLSAAVTGLAGALYAQYFLFLDAGIAFGAHVSVEALVAPIVGGLGTVLGPVVGALALHGAGELMKLLAGRIPGVDLVVFGVLLILAVAFAPRGLVGLWRSRKGGGA